MRRSLALTTWIAATAAASGLAWTAVDQVAARVADRAAATGPPAARIVGRGSDRPPDSAEPEAGTAAPGPTSTTTLESPSAPPPSPASAPPADSSGRSLPAPPAGPAPTNPPKPDPPAPSASASVFVTGGTVTARCDAGTPRLVGAVPRDGFTTSVASGVQLVVDFTSRTHHSIVEAECDGTRVQFSTGEEPAG